MSFLALPNRIALSLVTDTALPEEHWPPCPDASCNMEPVAPFARRKTTMSHATLNADSPILSVSVDNLVAEHGTWRVVFEAIKAMVRRKRRVQTIHPRDLPPSIRRDIGLPAVVDPPPLPTVMMVYARP